MKSQMIAIINMEIFACIILSMVIVKNQHEKIWLRIFKVSIKKKKKKKAGLVSIVTKLIEPTDKL